MNTNEKGVALVEFAFVLPTLLILVLLISEFGRALYQYNLATKSVRDAARYLSVQIPSTHTEQARSLVIYGNLDGSGAPLDPSLESATIETTWGTAGSAPVLNTVTVRVSDLQFRPMIANFFGMQFAAISLNDIEATMRSPL